MAEESPRAVLVLTGSVAAVKATELLTLLLRHMHVDVVLTPAALHFVDVSSLSNCSSHRTTSHDLAIYSDSDEWTSFQRIGDRILHVELRKRAHVLIFAPLSANSLAKIANGLCDNLATCIARCWDFSRCAAIAAPAMNTLMYEHPFTAEHLDRLRRLGFILAGPVCKELACGDSGSGAMEDPSAIVDVVRSQLNLS
jgi:phosphopantothenoylcysteine decarboxylase